MAKFRVDPTLSSALAFESVELAMPKAHRRAGQGTRHRLRRLAGETRTRRVQVIDGVSVTIAPGESVAVLSVDGGGCVEFLRLAAGTLVPDAGQVRRRSEVVPILDDSRCLDASYTVRQNIYVVGALLGMSPEQVSAKLKWIVEMAGAAKWLDAFLRAAPKNLRQRLVWSVTMATDARIFAIEEAVVVGKDEIAERCWTYMDALRAQGVTFVITAGDREVLERFCDRAIVLQDGRIVADTSVAEALPMVRLQHPRHAHREAPADDDDDSGPVV